MYSIDAQQYPAYALNVVDIHLRFGATLPTPKPPLITKIPDTPTASEPPVSKKVDPNNNTISAQAQLAVEPPFPEKLVQSKPMQIEKKYFDIVD